jgi:uncharacterized protein YkwD
MSGGSGTSSIQRDATLENQILVEVNAYRASKGMKALHRHAGLDRLALQHSEFLAKTQGSYGLYGKSVSHIGFEQRALTAKQAYQIKSSGENVIASTDRSAKRLVKFWEASEGHEYNMRSDWFCTGIGSAVTPEGKVITTQIFGVSPSTSHRDMADRFSNQW